MRFQVSEENPTCLDLEQYARIRMSFEVSRVFDVEVVGPGFGGFALVERRLETPYLKDYDAIESPREWSRYFDMTNWGFFAARSEGARVGGAAIAFDTEGVTMLENRRDLAVLWDIRVDGEARGQGVGTALFQAAENWARARGCRQLKVETQNINVPACRFYAKQGCVLGAIHRFAYPELPDEAQLLWYKHLMPLLNYRLIAASPEDEAWLETLRRNVYHELFYATWGGWDEGRHTRQFSEFLERGHIFIIEEDCTRVGMIQIFDEANAVEVAEIQVHPAAQNRGVGTAVLKDVIARAHERRKSVQLRVGLKNERAYRLYERLGFRRVNRTDTHNHMVCEPDPE